MENYGREKLRETTGFLFRRVSLVFRFWWRQWTEKRVILSSLVSWLHLMFVSTCLSCHHNLYFVLSYRLNAQRCLFSRWKQVEVTRDSFEETESKSTPSPCFIDTLSSRSYPLKSQHSLLSSCCTTALEAEAQIEQTDNPQDRRNTNSNKNVHEREKHHTRKSESQGKRVWSLLSDAELSPSNFYTMLFLCLFLREVHEDIV